MTAITKFLANLSQQQDAALFLLLIMVIGMMILPVPTQVMDLLIAANLSLAVLILLVTLTAKEPLEFSTFPSIILIATLFRLALSIGTTRLILKDGDAGQIIETFGEQVIAGNLVVGLVIFLMITVVQFLVVTKGADRVAEVSARFTLDALPGKQMSIDADLRAGNIDQAEARSRRQDLALESKLYGAMDGAMKFVKGDAIAGLVVTAINLIGGIVIGHVQRGMSMSDAVSTYSLLTIGDGLVAQIPALLISVASGALVTRVARNEKASLGAELGDQIFGGPRPRLMAGPVLIGFGFVPGFPTVVFCLIGGGLLLSGLVKVKAQRRSLELAAQTNDSWRTYLDHQTKLAAKLHATKGARPTLVLRIPHAMKAFDSLAFARALDRTRADVFNASGLTPGHWTVELCPDPASLDCQFHLNGTLVHHYSMAPEALFVRLSESQLAALDFTPQSTTPAGAWMAGEDADRLRQKGIAYHDALDVMMFHLTDALRASLVSFVTVQSISASLERIEKSMPALVDEVRDVCSNAKLAEVIRRLVEEEIPAANTVQILEAVLEWAPKESDTVLLVEHVRAALANELAQKYTANGLQNVVLIAPSTEGLIREGVRSTASGSFLILPPDTAGGIAKQAQAFSQGSYRSGEDAVLLTHMDIRRHLQQLLSHRGIDLPVLSFQEIPSSVTVYPVGFIK